VVCAVGADVFLKGLELEDGGRKTKSEQVVGSLGRAEDGNGEFSECCAYCFQWFVLQEKVL
jgi:hypothetical protein